jgi:hypothetical protein
VTGPQALGSPVRREVEAELERVAERWRQLPLDRALLYSERVRLLVQSLAERAAQLSGIPSAVVPDLGPATLLDQLTVMVYDASGAATTLLPQASTVSTSTLVADLAMLRRDLA